MKQWVIDSDGALALPLAVSLGLDANTGKEAMAVIIDWIDLPRNLIELRSAETMLRAFIDFECEMNSLESHQSMIDNELLSAVDSAVVPIEIRAVINDALGSRPEQKRGSEKAAQHWTEVRPTNAVIDEWFRHRFQQLV